MEKKILSGTSDNNKSHVHDFTYRVEKDCISHAVRSCLMRKLVLGNSDGHYFILALDKPLVPQNVAGKRKSRSLSSEKVQIEILFLLL